MRCLRALRMLRALPILLAIPAWPQIGAVVAAPQDPQGQARQLNIDTFEKVWSTIRDKHWEQNPGGLNWQAIHEEFRPRIEKAANIEEVRTALKDMLSRLHETHFGILPSTVYEEVSAAGDAAGAGGEIRAGSE